jgi:Flp pilus assembly protein TadD
LYGATKALEIKDKALVYTMDPSVWTEKPYDLASIAAWNLGQKDLARQMCLEALKFAPNDNRLIKNLELMTEDENA